MAAPAPRSPCAPTAPPRSLSAARTAASYGKRHDDAIVMGRRTRAMRRALGIALLAVAAVPSGVDAQPADLSHALVGTWKGEVQMASGTYPRTLVIKSVQRDGRQRFLEADYGGPPGHGSGGAVLEPVDVQLLVMGADVVLRFRSEDLSPVELTLFRDGRYLTGSVLAPSIVGGARLPAAI